MNALRRFQSWMLSTLGLALGIVVAVNTTVDPWRVLDLPWSSTRLDRYREVETNYSRTAKTGLARARQWDGAIFGTSRVGSGLRPSHPAFDGLRIANLGLDGGPLWVGHALFSDFLDHQAPKLIVFSVAPTALYVHAEPDPADFDRSPLVDGGDRVERELRYVAGFATFVASVETLFRWAIGRTPVHSQAGDRSWNGPTDRLAANATYLDWGVTVTRNMPIPTKLDADQQAIVEDVIERSQAAGARLILMRPPNHARLQLAIHETAPAGFDVVDSRRFLADAVDRANARNPEGPPVEYWDFDDLHPINREPLPRSAGDPPMQYWFDLVHVAPALGDLMVERMMGGDGDVEPPYGTRLDGSNVEAYIERLDTEMRRYAQEHPDAAAEARALAAARRADTAG